LDLKLPIVSHKSSACNWRGSRSPDISMCRHVAVYPWLFLSQKILLTSQTRIETFSFLPRYQNLLLTRVRGKGVGGQASLVRCLLQTILEASGIGPRSRRRPSHLYTTIAAASRREQAAAAQTAREAQLAPRARGAQGTSRLLTPQVPARLGCRPGPAHATLATTKVLCSRPSIPALAPVGHIYGLWRMVWGVADGV